MGFYKCCELCTQSTLGIFEVMKYLWIPFIVFSIAMFVAYSLLPKSWSLQEYLQQTNQQSYYQNNQLPEQLVYDVSKQNVNILLITTKNPDYQFYICEKESTNTFIKSISTKQNDFYIMSTGINQLLEFQSNEDFKINGLIFNCATACQYQLTENMIHIQSNSDLTVKQTFYNTDFCDPFNIIQKKNKVLIGISKTNNVNTVSLKLDYFNEQKFLQLNLILGFAIAFAALALISIIVQALRAKYEGCVKAFFPLCTHIRKAWFNKYIKSDRKKLSINKIEVGMIKESQILPIQIDF